MGTFELKNYEICTEIDIEIEIEDLMDQVDQEELLDHMDEGDVLDYLEDSNIRDYLIDQGYFVADDEGDALNTEIDDSTIAEHLTDQGWTCFPEDNDPSDANVEKWLSVIPIEKVQEHIDQHPDRNLVRDEHMIVTLEEIEEMVKHCEAYPSNKLKAIKKHRELFKVRLTESKDHVEHFMKHGFWSTTRPRQEDEPATLNKEVLQDELFTEQVEYFTLLSCTSADPVNSKTSGSTKISFEVPIVHSIETILRALEGTDPRHVISLIEALTEYSRLTGLTSHEDALDSICP